MSDRPSDPAELEPDAPQGSVFGNLPDSRPGGRSPRRDAAAKPRKTATKAAPKRPAKPKTTPKAATAASPKPRPKPARRPPEPPADERESGNGLEDIAWAGVAAAAEAATVGVRLLSKTIEALRGNSERS